MDKEDVVLIYTMEYYSALKIINSATCSNVVGPRDYHAEWSKSDKDKYMLSFLYGTLKNDASELLCKTETDSQT